ncbi:MAG: hypothetical protein HGA39_08605 [Coriobacteriia bacterium]|nr:hypothetical protein [Coriobacteriia bacterium]
MFRVGVRTQLVAAASMWLVGASVLLSRGTLYARTPRWDVWALAAGLVLGAVKARLLLKRVARKAVIRIQERGRGTFFGFFSAKSWLLIGTMIGSGIALRHVFVNPGLIEAGILGAIYIGVGAALLIADRIFWRAVFAPSKKDTPTRRPT